MTAILNRVALTGADHHNDIDALIAFQAQYPQAELGMLYAPSQTEQGIAGFPTDAWAFEFARRAKGPKALHLCFESIDDFLAREAEVWTLARQFNRVQLNIFQRKRPVDPVHVDAAAALFKQETRGDVIVPMNPGNADMVMALQNQHLHFSFDRSGGTGKLAESYPAPLAGRYCGWAGGLGPDNIQDEIQKMAAVATGPYWIDMESRLKGADGHFDIGRCDLVMQKLSSYLSPLP